MMYGTTTMAQPVATYGAPANYGGLAQFAGAPQYTQQIIETVAAPVTYAQPAYETVAAPVTYAQQYAAPTTMTYAAPTVVETVQAAPTMVMEQVAAPQVTYAAPMSYAAPMVETVAAPQYTTMAAPVSYAPMTTQVPSYVAAPQYAMQQQMIVAPQAPMAPMKLTEGIPTPEQIAAQKSGYSAALDKQLKEAIDTVQKETQIEKEMIKFTAEKTIALYNMQVDERLTEAMATADEQATFALLELNKAKVERNLQLNAQANGLVMDYQMKAVQTELAQKQYAFQMEYAKKEGALAEQYNQQVAKAQTGTTYSVPAAAVR